VTGLRMVGLHLASRRVPAALAVLVVSAVLLRVALHWPWDAYGALQLPLFFETACAIAVAASMVSPFGDPERATGRWLPYLRLGTAVALAAVAVGALALAVTGSAVGGGPLGVLRDTIGLTGIGLLCAAALGGALAWAGPTAYLVAGVYAQYTLWHGPALTTPWLWPARPPTDVGAALCAGAVFVAGVVVVSVRGARVTVVRN
jgi:hypothetical protein